MGVRRLRFLYGSPFHVLAFFFYNLCCVWDCQQFSVPAYSYFIVSNEPPVTAGDMIIGVLAPPVGALGLPLTLYYA